MELEALQLVALAMAQEHEPAKVLGTITSGLARLPGVALVRMWLISPGDICPVCPMRFECPDQSRCLHLVASNGTPLNPQHEDWSRIDGAFRRFPLNVRKIGYIGATGTPIHLETIAPGSAWIARPDWTENQHITSFAGHPLIFQGEILGVLAVFSRATITKQQAGWLRMFADQAAVAIANCRAFAEINRLRRQLELENQYLREEVNAAGAYSDIIGQSPALQKVLQQVDLVAPTDATVLILGESGTGKELIARAIHERSRRQDRALIKVNCASIPKDLFESEFFGHVKGAFTGAVRDRVGRFQLADQGTLFLDEVGEIPLELQGKLLRVLQEGQFERVGDDHPRTVKVRLLSATNRNLKQDVQAGKFREDLYYRLSVFPIEVPPLRERREDIPRLANFFIGRICRQHRFPALTLTAEQAEALAQQSWPGNIRELHHTLERAVILGQGKKLVFESEPASFVQPAAQPPMLFPAPVPPFPVVAPPAVLPPTPPQILSAPAIKQQERDSILAALRHTRGKIFGPGGAAELLGLKGTTLASKLKAYGISKQEYRDKTE